MSRDDENSQKNKRGAIDGEALGRYNRTRAKEHCNAAAIAYANNDRSDPFAYSRALSQMQAGVAESGDYSGSSRL